MKPILFSTPMVRAIVVGLKRQTRRLSDKYEVGDELWVRETFQVYPPGKTVHHLMRGFPFEKIPKTKPDGCKIRYKADGGTGPWRPSLFMPKWAARIFLKVSRKRQEPLQNISYDDCLKEGILKPGIERWLDFGLHKNDAHGHEFSLLWNSINKAPGKTWEDNPMAWVYEFEVIKGERG